MSFILWQLEQIWTGGFPVLWVKIRRFPRRLLATRYGRCLVHYGRRLAVAIAPGWADGHIRLARLLTQSGRTEQGIAHWHKAVSVKPDGAEARVRLAEALIGLGRFDEAFASWEQAFSFQPDWPEVHNRIQNAFYFCAQTWAARSIMQRVLDAYNDFGRAHQLYKLGVRFVSEFPTAIGHIALLDYYVKMDMLGQRSPARPVLLVNTGLANPCYLGYWRQYLPHMITDPVALELLSPLAKYLEDRIFVVADSSGRQIVGFDYGAGAQQAAIQAQWEAEGRGPLLSLTDSDRERGWDCLQRLGVPPDAWFVGLHVREGGERSRGARNADIGTYLLAMESIVQRGGWVIRMGHPSMTSLPPIPQVIDYANSEVRRDWMDVFLWASCRFFIGTQSGPAFVPPTFGVPCVATNWNFLYRRWFGQDLFILKVLWSQREQRYLSFKEALTSSVGVAESLDYLASQGITVVDNTPEDIKDVVVEMMDRLDGKLEYSQQDKELQERFDEVWISNAYKANARIGRAFLRKWAHLL